MSRRVRVNTGFHGITLPNGGTYDGQVEVLLSDAEYSAIPAQVFSQGIVTDLGAVANRPLDFPSPGASDAELAAGLATKTAWTEGLLAARPTAAVAFAAAGGPVLYFATDDNGGTLYRTATGTSWSKVAPGASESVGQLIIQYESQNVFSTASTSAVDVTGLTGMGVTGWGGDVKMRLSIPIATTTLGTRVVFQVVDDLANTWIAFPTSAPNPANGNIWLSLVRRIPVASIANGVTRTFKAQIYTAGASTVSVQASASNPALVEFFRA